MNCLVAYKRTAQKKMYHLANANQVLRALYFSSCELSNKPKLKGFEATQESQHLYRARAQSGPKMYNSQQQPTKII